MRPYVTIVKDAFHEALVSKTMWVLLVLTTVFLAALAPFWIEDRVPRRFEWSDLRDQDGLVREINRQAAAEGPSPGKRIVLVASGDDAAEAPDEEDSDDADEPSANDDNDAGNAAQVEENADDADDSRAVKADVDAGLTPTRRFPRRGDARHALNKAVASRDLYDEAAWADYKLGDEARGLIDRGVESLDDEEVERLNRLLLEAAYGRFLNVSPTDARLGYAAWDMDVSLGTQKAYILASILNGFTDYFVGTVGIMAALVVTSTFIPRTFETGAVDLLLSKPVSRSLVYLAKFFGGCAFVTVLASYLIGGLYLIAGLRLNYWNHRFLWCVPLLLFLFAIYYSVSALAGVLWRNAIVSIVMAVVFWGACFAMGLTKGLMDGLVMLPQQVSRLEVHGDELFGTFVGTMGSPSGAIRRWDDESGKWVETFAFDDAVEIGPAPWEGRFTAAPVYAPKSGRLFASGNLYDFKSGNSTGPWLFAAEAGDDWRQQVLGQLDKDVRHLLVRADGALVGLATDGIFEIPTDGKPLDKRQLRGDPGENRIAAREIATADWAIPVAAAAHNTSTDIAVYDPGRLRVLKLVDGKRYEVRSQYAVAPQAMSDPDALAFVDDRLVLGLFDGRVLVFAVKEDKLDLLAELPQVEKTVVKQVVLAPRDMSFAVRRDDETVTWYECDAAGEVTSRPIDSSAQGDITAIALAADGRLAAAYAYNHVVWLDAERRAASKLSPDYSGMERLYWYGLLPVYTIFPKPGELGNLSAYLLHGKETIRVGDGPGAVEQKLDIYTPIWSNLLFLSVMLAIACWYVRRRDF